MYLRKKLTAALLCAAVSVYPAFASAVDLSSAPAFAAEAAEAERILSFSLEDYYIEGDPFTVTGRTVGIDSVIITIDETVKFRLNTSANENWTVSPNVSLTAGPHTITAATEDGALSQTETFYISAVNEISGENINVSADADSFNVSVNIEAEPGSRRTVIIDTVFGREIYTAVSDDSGMLSFVYTEPLLAEGDAIDILVSDFDPSLPFPETVNVYYREQASYPARSKTLEQRLSEEVQKLRASLLNREEHFSLTFAEAVTVEQINDLYDAAVAHNGTPDEGDYILGHVASHEISMNTTTYKDRVAISCDISTVFRSTAAMEAEVDSAVDELLSSLNLSGKSDYEKIKAVYEWICSNVKYDNEGVDDENDAAKFTAYGALIEKSAVCQGYALLLYRLASELGIDCRFIEGKGITSAGTENHAWNIVKLGDLYYYLDSTWDSGRDPYDYFLKGSEDFGDHIPTEKYLSSDFTSKYPISAKDYSPAPPATKTVYNVDELRSILSLDGELPESGPIFAEVKLTKDGISDGNDVIVIAMYSADGEPENRSLAGLKLISVGSDFNQGQKSYACQFNRPSGTTIKVFVLDDFTGLKPLSNVLVK